jgi:IPT/TIG domain
VLRALRTAALAVCVGASLTLVAVSPAPVEATQRPPKPVVTKVDPKSGPTSGGTLVTIKGKHLKTATKVLFGSAKGTQLKVASDRKLTVLAPPHAVGNVDVRVKTKGGKSATSPLTRFAYVVQKPSITAVSPSSGPNTGGTRVTLTGVGFVGVTSVTFDGIPGSAITVSSPTSLQVTSPAHSTQLVHINVITPAGTSRNVSEDRFRFLPGVPQVTGVAPGTGPTAGGTRVTLTGNDFENVQSVTFGGVAGADVTVLSLTQLEVTTPPGAGTVDVVVTTLVGTSPVVAGSQFTYS